MSGAVGKATESAAGTVTAANVKSVMMARRRALRAVAVRSTRTRMFSSLRSVVVGFSTGYVRVMREKR
jgi:ribosomal protein L17